MLKKLQTKFILINMALVSTVLLLVFAALMISTYQQNANEIYLAMQRALQRDDAHDTAHNPLPEIGRTPEEESFKEDPHIGFTPTITVTVDLLGNTRIDGPQAATIDAETLADAVDLVLKSEQPSGILSDYDLRYLKAFGTDGLMKIVFADRGQELSSMQNLLLSSLLIGGLGLVAFFFISLGLSRLALRPVERAWEQQRQFVADASHELKTPLTVILANIGILQAHPQDRIVDQQKWVDNTRAEGERMKKLIEDMLFLAKNDADRVSTLFTRIDLSDLVWNCLLPFEAVAYERDISLDPQIDSGLYVQGDSAQLKQLLLILLDNACKYSASHETITVSLHRSASSDAVLTVHNLGNPIPPQALPHIFERFYRADTSRARREDLPHGSSSSGYGLGLSIAKAIADRHRANLNAISSLEQGTTFSFTLPLSRE